MLSHALAPEGDAVSIVHDTVEYGVSDRAVCNKVMPACHGDLGRDQSGLPLIAFLDDFDFALPVRSEDEYMSQVSQPLRVEFLEHLNSRPIAPAIRFELPPEGLLIVTPPPHDSNLGQAQTRDPSAPNLLWNVRTGDASDQVVDRVYEERQMGGGNA